MVMLKQSSEWSGQTSWVLSGAFFSCPLPQQDVGCLLPGRRSHPAHHPEATRMMQQQHSWSQDLHAHRSL